MFTEEPESRIQEPRNGRIREQGSFNDGQVIIASEFSRIDLIYSIKPTTLVETDAILNLGPFVSVIEQFSPLANSLINKGNLPNIKRIALGSILLDPVENRIAGYKKISGFLHHLKIDQENSSDLSYQINHPRVCEVQEINLKINRLSKWSVAKRIRSQFEIGQSMQIMSELYACRVELDISTAAENQEAIPFQILSEFFTKLVTIGLEIAEKGDIP
jgi:hypothetical protein